MWPPMPQRKMGDLEGGAAPLYPTMLESPELRWAFIRKVYSILAVQLLVTVAVASLVVFVDPIPRFFTTTSAGLGLYIFTIIFPFLMLCPLFYYHQTHPLNYVLLGLFTIGISFAVGLTCAFSKGRVILEAVILAAVAVVSLTLYTFWAARRGKDFSKVGPLLFSALIILIVFGIIQLFFPMGRIGLMVYGTIGALIFCGYIIYDTDNLIKRHTYDEYIWAAIALYLDVINLFLLLLTLFSASES
ncbi:hypothetical protein AMTRI_Chr03g55080 [Amborella trichopoda]